MPRTEPRAESMDGIAQPKPASALMEALAWRFNRLRCMTPAEIAHRCARLAQAHAERAALARVPAVPAANLEAAPAAWVVMPTDINAAPYLAAAHRAAAGRFDVFALRDVALGNPPRWNRDPRTGI